MALVDKVKRNVGRVARRARLLTGRAHDGRSNEAVVNVEKLTPSSARRNNLQVALAVIGRAEADYFAIPDENRRYAKIGIDSHSWSQFCREMTSLESSGSGLICEILDLESSEPNQYLRVDLAGHSAEKTLKASKVLRLFYVQRDPLTKVTFRSNAACQIELWQRDDEGTLAAPVRNPRNSIIDSANQVQVETEINGMSVKTFEVFQKRNIFELVEPIDVVYMWVDGSDRAWIEKRNHTLSKITGQVFNDSVDASRFRDNGELKYSLRSIFLNAPWVRKIYLVTDAQIPSWLDPANPRIQVVDHTELFTEAGSLPTFNSHAIASRLHHIEGLSEQYIIFNDDVFLGNEVAPRSFFLSNGVAKFFLSQSTLPQKDNYELTHEAARNNVVGLLERDFGVTASRAFWHTPVPQLRSLMHELEAEYPEEFAKTSKSQIRSPEDLEINGWMHHNFGFAKRRTLNAKISYGYFEMSDSQLIPKLKAQKETRNLATFCLNDSPAASEENQRYVRSWLEEYFPYPAPWELVEGH